MGILGTRVHELELGSTTRITLNWGEIHTWQDYPALAVSLTLYYLNLKLQVEGVSVFIATTKIKLKSVTTARLCICSGGSRRRDCDHTRHAIKLRVHQQT